MIPTIETISVVCLTEDQEDGDLILDLMVDGINMVSYSTALFVPLFLNTGIFHEHYYFMIKTAFIVFAYYKYICKCILRFNPRADFKSNEVCNLFVEQRNASEMYYKRKCGFKTFSDRNGIINVATK